MCMQKFYLLVLFYTHHDLKINFNHYQLLILNYKSISNLDMSIKRIFLVLACLFKTVNVANKNVQPLSRL